MRRALGGAPPTVLAVGVLAVAVLSAVGPAGASPAAAPVGELHAQGWVNVPDPWCPVAPTVQVPAGPGGQPLPATRGGAVEAVTAPGVPSFARGRPGHPVSWLTHVACPSSDLRAAALAGPAGPAASAGTQGGASAGAVQHSLNWAGYVSAAKSSVVITQFAVPPLGHGPSGTSRSAIWTGVGQGRTSGNSLAQAGVEDDEYCTSATCAPNVYPWVELTPEGNQFPVQGLPVRMLDCRGDLLAAPKALPSGGTAFTVRFLAAGTFDRLPCRQ